MAERKTTTSKKIANAKTETQNAENENKQATPDANVAFSAPAPSPSIEEDLNLDVKVTIRNLAGWDVTFARLHDGVGDVTIVANGHQRLSRNEVIAQVNNNNKLFIGSDSIGSHATIYIDDEPTRKLLGFEEDGRPQMVFTEQLVVDLFNMKQAEYESMLPIYIRTRAEKYALIETIKKLRLNDYAKIVFASEYTGYKL